MHYSINKRPSFFRVFLFFVLVYINNLPFANTQEKKIAATASTSNSSSTSNTASTKAEIKTIKIRVAAYNYTMGFFDEAQNDKPCYLARDYVNDTSASVIDIIILCRALYLGGIKPDFQFEAFANYNQGIRYVAQGKAAIFSNSVGLQKIPSNSLLKSDALLKKNEYEKGIYALEGHRILNESAETLDLQQYRGITVFDWDLDISVLQSITPNSFSVMNYDDVFSHLLDGGADYTLLHIENSDDFRYIHYDLRLYPVTGVKIQFPQSRHFIFSKASPIGNLLKNATNRGLKIMRENGELEQILIKKAIFNPKAADWKILNQ